MSTVLYGAWFGLALCGEVAFLPQIKNLKCYRATTQCRIAIASDEQRLLLVLADCEGGLVRQGRLGRGVQGGGGEQTSVRGCGLRSKYCI